MKASRWVSGAYGPHTCARGYVWREAFSGDDVCVTPTVRQQVRADNAAAAGRVAKGASNGAAGASTASKSFTWKGSTAGHCNMYIGAKWTLYPNGTAQFDGTVDSFSGDDAWLMWAHLKDANGAILADIRVAGSNSTKFVKNLPVAWQEYRWLAKGQFDPSLYPLIKSMSLSKHC
ncbi:DUF6294 family protein [Microbispora bryophytorum]|uniref:DUF6294 family protein n=1 Tax=Microbispora bryophytorum TaxID=1460882 RepID=UPI00371F102D